MKPGVGPRACRSAPCKLAVLRVPPALTSLACTNMCEFIGLPFLSGLRLR